MRRAVLFLGLSAMVSVAGPANARDDTATPDKPVKPIEVNQAGDKHHHRDPHMPPDPLEKSSRAVDQQRPDARMPPDPLGNERSMEKAKAAAHGLQP